MILKLFCAQIKEAHIRLHVKAITIQQQRCVQPLDLVIPIRLLHDWALLGADYVKEEFGVCSVNASA